MPIRLERNKISPCDYKGTSGSKVALDYRPFFRAAIVLALTLGAGWGVLLLVRIAAWGSFTAVGVHEVNAHGHAQIFGWVGLFVMGFAYFALPRMKQTDLLRPDLARWSLWLMVGGIVVRSFSQALVGVSPWFGVPGTLASLAEIVAIAICLALVAQTLRRSVAGLAVPDCLVIAGLTWFFIQAVYGTAYFVATVLATQREQLLGLIATWQGPLREIQIHGFAMLVILGVSMRLLPSLYGLQMPGRLRSAATLVAVNAALVGVVAGLVLMRLAGHAWASLWYLSALLLASATASLVLSWGLYRRPARTDRGLKYIRAAYGWLLISLAMLVLLPLHQFVVLPQLAPESPAAAMGFSHAYYGAIRHAVTVGFVSLMIVGVSSRMVPDFVGADLGRLGPLWLPFLLINAGCAIRVIGQTLTDFAPSAFPVAGVSGLLELAGLAVWAVHLWGLMSRRAALPASSDDLEADRISSLNLETVSST